MSGTTGTDTSTSADRARFCALLFNAAGGSALAAQASIVQYCTLRLPEADAAMLGLREHATYADAVAWLNVRWGQGAAAT